jgi:hypothetical protein
MTRRWNSCASTGLREDRATLARVVHVLEVENDALRTALEAQEGIVNLASRRTAPA